MLPSVGPGGVEVGRLVEMTRITVRGAVTTITVVPAGRVTPATVLRTRDKRKSPLTGLSNRSVSSTKLAMRSRSARSRRCRSGCSAITLRAELRRRTVVSCPAAKRLAATRTTSATSGVDPSGNVAVARPVSTSWRGSRRRSSIYAANRPYKNSTAYRQTRGKRLHVVVHLDRLVVPRHHHHPMVALPPHWALRPHALQERIWVGEQLFLPEKIDRLDVAHGLHCNTGFSWRIAGRRRTDAAWWGRPMPPVSTPFDSPAWRRSVTIWNDTMIEVAAQANHAGEHPLSLAAAREGQGC